MNSYRVFFQKEWMEIIRTKKLYILMGIYVFFAMLSPVITRYMSEIVLLATDDLMTITIPPTTWIDSWSQFYSNISQIGCICVIFLFMGCVVGEKQSGSAALTLTKNLTHTNFIITKFIAAVVCLTVSILFAGLICYAYTYYLFGYAGKISDILMGLIAYNMFIFVLLSITILASTIARSTAVAALISFCSFITLSFSNLIPGVGHILPGKLLSQTTKLSYGIKPPELLFTFIMAILITVFCIFLSIRSLKKQEI